jgi:peptidoglycan DL-endopeptidase CwlO
MSNRLLFPFETKQATVRQQQPGGSHRILVPVIIGVAGIMLLGLLAVPILIGTNLFFAAGAGCSGQQTGTVGQPAAGAQAKTIPADYLFWYKKVGQQYGVPWPILAGIGTVESDNGRTTLPGVHSGANAFGAAGPMQIGIGGAAGNQWGGLAVHPASEHVNGVATDGDGDGIASVYDPADAIAGAAKYLVEHGVTNSVPDAIFAYNHSQSYVQLVMSFASDYARGGFSVSPVTVAQVPGCITGTGQTASKFRVGQAPNATVASAIAFAEAQLGKPYQWGATGPDTFDCSGLVMMAYRAAGVLIPRTSEEQWTWGPQVPASQAEPGDLVFFAGADGTPTSPGHVGLVIGGGLMIEAYATGFPIRIAPYGGRDPIGFTRPWTHSGVVLAAGVPSSG